MIERVICLVIGYAFGLIQTGYLYGKTQHIDIRTKGSGNAGTTNALRTMGWKAGVITLLGDCLKCVFAVLVVRLIFGGTYGDIMPVLSQYAGLGAILGHNYPFYMKFKGGKGIAVTAGIIITTWNIWIMLICLAVFLASVAATKYVSVGSLVVVVTYFICVVVYGRISCGWKPSCGDVCAGCACGCLCLLQAQGQYRPADERDREQAERGKEQIIRSG